MHQVLCVILAERDVSLAHQTANFLQQAKAFTEGNGKAPVWLAVGSAWTGLDIGGHDPFRAQFGYALPAGQDNIITDLVVPRIPFGTNRSLTHQFRMKRRPQVPWDTLDALFRLKQVLGRPVRREGLPSNRRFFLLDGRLNHPQFVGLRSMVKLLLTRYRVHALERPPAA